MQRKNIRHQSKDKDRAKMLLHVSKLFPPSRLHVAGVCMCGFLGHLAAESELIAVTGLAGSS